MTDKPLEQILEEFRQSLQKPEEVKAMLELLDSNKNRALTGGVYELLKNSYLTLKRKGASFDLQELSQKLEERISQDILFWESQADPVLSMDSVKALDFVQQIMSCRFLADEFNLPSRDKIKRLKYIYEQQEYSGGKVYFDFRLTGSLSERVSRFMKKTTSNFINWSIAVYDLIKETAVEHKEKITGAVLLSGIALTAAASIYGIIAINSYLKNKIRQNSIEAAQNAGIEPELAEKLMNSKYKLAYLSKSVQSPDKNKEAMLYRDNEIILGDKKGDIKLRSITHETIDDVSRIYWEGNDDLVLVKNRPGGETYVKLHILPNRLIHMGGEVGSLEDISRIAYSPDKEYGAFFIRNKNCVFIFDKKENYQLINEMFDRINRIYWESNKVLAVDTPNCGHPLRINTDEFGK